MSRYHLLSTSEDDTLAIGREIGAVVPKGTFIALTGDARCGKTTLVRGIAHGLDVPAWAALRSPTLSLMLTYHGGRCVLHHVDFYHLNEAPELPTRVEQALYEPDAVSVVEWADILREVWPEFGVLAIRMHLEESGKHIEVIDDRISLGLSLAERLDPWLAPRGGTHDTSRLAVAASTTGGVGERRRSGEDRRKGGLVTRKLLFGERRRGTRRKDDRQR